MYKVLLLHTYTYRFVSIFFLNIEDFETTCSLLIQAHTT